MSAPNHGRLVERLAAALRGLYGHRVREVAWSATEPVLVLDVELLGPVDVDVEKMRMARAIYDIVAEAGVMVVLNPVEAGRAEPPADYQPNEKHVARIAARLAEQIRVYHDATWDYADPDNRRLAWRAAKRIAEVEDREIAAILGKEIKP